MASRRNNTHEEINALAARLPAPDAVEKLCTMMAPLVVSMARRYFQPIIGAETSELEQVAWTGVLEACGTFDAAKGRFPTHVMWSVRSALAIYVGQLANPVRLPHKFTFRLPKLRRALDELELSLHRPPTIAELAEKVNLSEKTIATMLTYDEGALSMDAFRERRDSVGERWVESYESPTMSPEDQLIAREEFEEVSRLNRRIEHEREA